MYEIKEKNRVLDDGTIITKRTSDKFQNRREQFLYELLVFFPDFNIL